MMTASKSCVKEIFSVPCSIGTDVWILNEYCSFAKNDYVKGTVIGYKILENTKFLIIKEDVSKFVCEFSEENIGRVVFYSPNELHEYVIHNNQ